MTKGTRNFIFRLVGEGLDIKWLRGLSHTPARSRLSGLDSGSIKRMNGYGIIKPSKAKVDGEIVNLWAPGVNYDMALGYLEGKL